MKGVILAGGLGTRLQPLTKVTNKHLLPVYKKPMIYYPIETLRSMGIREILLVSGGEHIGAFAELLKDGDELGVKLTYKVQVDPNGIAGALRLAEKFVGTGLFCVILGDNYFEKPQELPTRPTIYLDGVENPNRFGVYDMSKNEIEEKPKRKFRDNFADVVTGLYAYDDTVFEFIEHLKPSERNELEITAVNNFMLRNGAEAKYVKGYWSDMGTFDSLYTLVERMRNEERIENSDI